MSDLLRRLRSRTAWSNNNLETARLAEQKWVAKSVRTPLFFGISNGVSYFDTRPPTSQPETKEPDGYTVVLAHGFGLSKGIWSRNIDDIMAIPNVKRVVAFDWPGMGVSDRLTSSPKRRFLHKENLSNNKDEHDMIHNEESPTKKVLHQWKRRVLQRITDIRKGTLSKSTSQCLSSSTHPSEAVNVLLDPIISLRQVLHLRNVVLVAHSLGGFLGTHLAARHSDLVHSLVLASPVGVVDGIVSSEERGKQLRRAPAAIRLVDALWRMNVTPQQLVRLASKTRARAMAKSLATRIFGDTYDNEAMELLTDYLLPMITAQPSGEYAMSSLLHITMTSDHQGLPHRKHPMATSSSSRGNTRQSNDGSIDNEPTPEHPQWMVHAREPVTQLLHALPMPIHFIYGDRDWLFLPTVPDLIRKLRAQINADPMTASGSQDTDKSVTLTVLPNAGHHLYSNNPVDFTKAIRAAIAQLPPLPRQAVSSDRFSNESPSSTQIGSPPMPKANTSDLNLTANQIAAPPGVVPLNPTQLVSWSLLPVDYASPPPHLLRSQRSSSSFASSSPSSSSSSPSITTTTTSSSRSSPTSTSSTSQPSSLSNRRPGLTRHSTRSVSGTSCTLPSLSHASSPGSMISSPDSPDSSLFRFSPALVSSVSASPSSPSLPPLMGLSTPLLSTPVNTKQTAPSSSHVPPIASHSSTHNLSSSLPHSLVYTTRQKRCKYAAYIFPGSP